MAFDGIVTGAIVKDLNEALQGLRLDRIYQVERDEILLHFRKQKLLISSSGNNPRIYLTEESKDNPKTPPIFTMVMRKHLAGAIVKEITQFGNDRVLEIKFSAWDDFSEKVDKYLIVEIMGRHSNIILVDENYVIIDAIKRVNDTMSRVREVLPHLEYKYLADERKIDPITSSNEEITRAIYGEDGNKSIENVIFHNFTGFSKNVGTEVAIRSSLDPSRPLSSLDDFEKHRISENLIDLISEIKSSNYKNRLYLDGDKIVDFHVLNFVSLEGLEFEEFNNSSELLDAVYRKRDNDDRMGQKSQAIKKIVSQKLSKDKSKLANLHKDLLEAENREKYRVYADVLSANFHMIEPGQKEIKLQNFYSEDLEDVVIPLDEKISGPQNAQRYYKKFAKLKNAENILTSQIKETQFEVEYLESILFDIELAEDAKALDEIKEELIDQSYIKRKQNRKKVKEKDIEFRSYEKDGFKIYCGKNNRENDLLTHKFARKEDLWFHVQGLPGSHVIIKSENKEIPDQVIEFAAKIAAYYSKARSSGSVEVDYTKKQNVKRHPANKPGLVNYTDFNTILVPSSGI